MRRQHLIFLMAILLAALSPLRGSRAQTPDPPIDVSQFVELQQFGRHRSEGFFPLTIQWSPDGTSLAVSSDAVYLWDPASGRELLKLKTSARTIDWSPDGARLAGSDYGNTFYIWDAASGEALFTMQLDEHITGVAWSPDGIHLAIGGINNVSIWNTTSYDLLLNLPSGASGLAWSPDGSYLAAVCNWCTNSAIYNHFGRAIFTFYPSVYSDVLEGELEIDSIVWSPDSRHLAYSWFGTGNYHRLSGVHVLELAHKQDLYSIPFDYGENGRKANAVAWSPDGTRLAIWGNEALIGIYDAENGAKQLDIPLTTDIYSAAWSPDSRYLAASDSGGVYVWEAASGRKMVTLTATSQVEILAWSPDGTRLASGGGNGVVRIWGMPDQ